MLLSCFLAAFSTEKPIVGIVVDSISGDPVPFANVFFEGASYGTITDTLGNFTLNERADFVWISAVGYHKQRLYLHSTQNVYRVKLKPEVFEMNELKVKPNSNREKWILNQVVKNKGENNPEKYQRFSYEKYAKWDYALNNVEKSLMKSNTFKNHQQLFKMSPNGTWYVPVYFSEQLVYNEVQRKPSIQKSTIMADKTSGLGVLNTYELSGYTSGLSEDHNFYDNFVKYYDQNFVSPLANNGWFYYRYYVVDSNEVDGVKLYTFDFYPKRKGENVFEGSMVIDNKRFALHRLDVKLPEGNQLNFIKSMKVKIEYQVLHDSMVFYKSNYLQCEFDYFPVSSDSTKKRLELLYTEFNSYDKVEINPTKPIYLSNKKSSYESVKQMDYNKRTEEYWDSTRHTQLSEDDLEKYQLIDAVNQIKRVKLANEIAEMGLNGYLDMGKFELGPYPEFVQTNKIEGVRMYMGGRTSTEISENLMLYGGLGYGTKNKTFTERAGLGYKFDNARRKVLKVEYDDRYVRMGENRQILFLYENMLSPSETNLISSIFAINEVDELYRQNTVHLAYENEWRSGFNTTFMLDFNKQFSPEYYPFQINGAPVSSIQSYEASINMRYSWKESVVDDGFMRLYVSTDYPIVNVSTSFGRVSYSNIEDWFGKVHATVKGQKYFGQTYVSYALEAGKIFGKLPYTMLEIPRGNETYGYYRYDFNLINYLEFVHDQYIHAYFEYHMNGFFFNRLPLLKRLGIREVASAKTMIGSLSNKQFEGINFPVGLQSTGSTYWELGVGLENIFRFFRVEGVWRLNPSSISGVPNVGIHVKLEIKFKYAIVRIICNEKRG